MTNNYLLPDIVVPATLDADGKPLISGSTLNTNWPTEVALGNVPGYSVVTKFGKATVSTSLIPVTNSGVYQTPIAATALEFVSSDANDTAAGTGAQAITIVGLDSTWTEVTQTIATNGLTAVPLTTDLIRLYRWYVSASGTYATATAGSHAGTLTIRVASAGATWSTIPLTPFPAGQSLIGAYTVPIGYTGYIIQESIFADTTKTADFYFFKRDNADDVTTPFTGAMRVDEIDVGVAGGFSITPASPNGPFVGPCDIGYMASVPVTDADVSVTFKILLVAD